MQTLFRLCLFSYLTNNILYREYISLHTAITEYQLNILFLKVFTTGGITLCSKIEGIILLKNCLLLPNGHEVTVISYSEAQIYNIVVHFKLQSAVIT